MQNTTKRRSYLFNLRTKIPHEKFEWEGLADLPDFSPNQEGHNGKPKPNFEPLNGASWGKEDSEVVRNEDT